MIDAVLLRTEKEARLYEMGAFGFVVVDDENVCIDDLLNANRQGAIVRCRGNPSELIRFFPPHDSPHVGCVAGWISDEDY